MKRLLSVFVTGALFFTGLGSTFAYNPTTEDQALIDRVEQAIDVLATSNPERLIDLTYRIEDVLPSLPEDSRVTHILTHVYNYTKNALGNSDVDSLLTDFLEGDDDYYDDEDEDYDDYDDEFEEEEIEIAELPANLQSYIAANYSASIEEAYMYDDGFFVELSDGTGVDFDENGNFLDEYHEDDYDDEDHDDDD